MENLENILSLARTKAKLDSDNSWTEGSKTYLDEISDEIDEVKEELDLGRNCYLEDELADVLWDYLNILAALELERGISAESVFKRGHEKYRERVEGIVSGELWANIKSKQKLRLAEEFEASGD